MSTNFPGNVDIFQNPVITKIDGVDLVRAAHVNDLQDAVKAIENLIITPGFTFDWSAVYIPNNTPITGAIKILDTELDSLSDDFLEHKALVLPIDPSQHHANVIEVTPISNLASSRAQAAFEELQSDINNIMSGGNVEGVTLDDRYITVVGNNILQGDLTVEQDLEIQGDTVLGTTVANQTTINGNLDVTNGADITGNLTVSANIITEDGQWIGLDSSGGLSFDTESTVLKSHKDIIFQIDADDLFDGGPYDGALIIKNGLGDTVFSIDENADITGISDLTATGDITCNTIKPTSFLMGSGVNQLELTSDSINLRKNSLHIDIDNDVDQVGEKFLITKNNDPGTNLASSNLLLHIDENALMISGIHKLRSGIQETGFFGMQFFSPDPGNIFSGTGVNFKHLLTNPPSSITLNVLNNINAQDIAVVYSDIYGFMFEFASVIGGDTRVYGTYTTVGN